MVDYSERHDAWYQSMVSELLQYGSLQDSVNDILRTICQPSQKQARWIDDLYEIYGNKQVLDEND